ncbi:MAG: hypothetical protein HY904_20265 [Deltaproteobacteria bacterium]|nr:hypothetical protein [Deltaproteobacteria bacterium]
MTSHYGATTCLTQLSGEPYFNLAPTNNPRGEWSQSFYVRQAQGPDGGYADYYFSNTNSQDQAEVVLLMRRRDADFFPIDREWIDLSRMLPSDVWESPGATLWFDGEWWVLIAFIHQSSGPERLIIQKFKVE